MLSIKNIVCYYKYESHLQTFWVIVKIAHWKAYLEITTDKKLHKDNDIIPIVNYLNYLTVPYLNKKLCIYSYTARHLINTYFRNKNNAMRRKIENAKANFEKPKDLNSYLQFIVICFKIYKQSHNFKNKHYFFDKNYFNMSCLMLKACVIYKGWQRGRRSRIYIQSTPRLPGDLLVHYVSG